MDRCEITFRVAWRPSGAIEASETSSIEKADLVRTRVATLAGSALPFKEVIMSENLICPKCNTTSLYWLDPEQEDLLENGIIECKNCDSKFKGIPGWLEATTGEDITEKPYLQKARVLVDRKYNPNYGDHRLCLCGHSYHRHFDSYDAMRDVGCKYCACTDFKEDPDSNNCVKKKSVTIDGAILEEPDYDPGLLNDYGGGDVNWWMDYIRTEINACNAYWKSLIESHTEL